MTEKTALANRLQDMCPQRDEFYRDVIDGMDSDPRQIPPKYFYDEIGSRLFERICEQPEYYPTRVEVGLLDRHSDEIAELIGNNCSLVEPGSGSCEKVRLLLDTLKPARYVPMDISCEHLNDAASRVAADYPWLDVHAVCADITRSVDLPRSVARGQHVIFYPGSSIGNYEPGDALGFLSRLAEIAGPGGGLLIGVDLVKDAGVLDDAYNDAGGVTAEFNLNLLHRINRELDGDIDTSTFRHHAFYNQAKSRIEMHLVSECAQTLCIDGHEFEINAGESIHTENSYKYTTEGFQALAEQAGFTPETQWIDDDTLFSLHYLRA